MFIYALLFSPGVLSRNLVPAKFQKRLLQPGIQDRSEPPRGGLFAAQGSVTPQFGSEPATFVSVYPDEESRMRGRGCAISHTVSPIFGETVILRGSGQTATGHRQPHGYVGPATGYVIPP